MATAAPSATSTIPGYSHEDLARLQQSDPLISPFYTLWRRGGKPGSRQLKHESSPLRALIKRWDRIEVRGEVLYVRFHDPVEGDSYQLLLPAELQPMVMDTLHNQAGHQGRERTLALIRKRCFWPGMATTVEKWCQKCERCTVSKAPTPAVRPSMGRLLAERPLDILAIDFTILEKATDGRENVLVMTDVFSKFSQAVLCRYQKASTVAKVLVEVWFQKFGVPRRIHSDQGRNFESQLVKDLCGVYGIQKSRTTAYHPQGNGQCERFNRRSMTVSAHCHPGKNADGPNTFESSCSCTIASRTHLPALSPFLVFMGQEPTLPIDLLLNPAADADKLLHVGCDSWVEQHQQRLQAAAEVARKRQLERSEARCKRNEERVNDKGIAVGTRVLLRNRIPGRNKIGDHWQATPYKVTARPHDNVYEVQLADGTGPRKRVTRTEVLDTGEFVPEGDSTSEASDNELPGEAPDPEDGATHDQNADASEDEPMPVEHQDHDAEVATGQRGDHKDGGETTNRSQVADEEESSSLLDVMVLVKEVDTQPTTAPSQSSSEPGEPMADGKTMVDDPQASDEAVETPGTTALSTPQETTMPAEMSEPHSFNEAVETESPSVSQSPSDNREPVGPSTSTLPAMIAEPHHPDKAVETESPFSVPVSFRCF
ncbi:uncharacterized protein LOC119742731 [Patiria miniata]|uniref:Integrase catalytic domain-containing protein n=1 Tax=Patiria miniata TaxID=46514 RepID=A0A914BF03_PATMI|nr:uncharacterized protein LOC119742731 [Patiria miniata]